MKRKNFLLFFFAAAQKKKKNEQRFALMLAFLLFAFLGGGLCLGLGLGLGLCGRKLSMAHLDQRLDRRFDGLEILFVLLGRGLAVVKHEVFCQQESLRGGAKHGGLVGETFFLVSDVQAKINFVADQRNLFALPVDRGHDGGMDGFAKGFHQFGLAEIVGLRNDVGGHRLDVNASNRLIDKPLFGDQRVACFVQKPQHGNLVQIEQLDDVVEIEKKKVAVAFARPHFDVLWYLVVKQGQGFGS